MSDKPTGQKYTQAQITTREVSQSLTEIGDAFLNLARKTFENDGIKMLNQLDALLNDVSRIRNLVLKGRL